MNDTTTLPVTPGPSAQRLGLINASAGEYAPDPVTGVMRFREMTGAWGTIEPAIAYAIAVPGVNAVRIKQITGATVGEDGKCADTGPVTIMVVA